MRLINPNDKYFSTLKGVASVIDLFGVSNASLYDKILYGYSDHDAFQIDINALASDWFMVGQDLSRAFNTEIEKVHNGKQSHKSS